MKIYVYQEMLILARDPKQADNAHEVLTGKQRTYSITITNPGPGMIERAIDASRALSQLSLKLE